MKNCPKCNKKMEKLSINHPLDFICKNCNFSCSIEKKLQTYNDLEDSILYKIYILICIVAILTSIALVIAIYNIKN